MPFALIILLLTMSNKRHAFSGLGVDVKADLNRFLAEQANKENPSTGSVRAPTTTAMPYQSLPDGSGFPSVPDTMLGTTAPNILPIVCQSTMNMHHDFTDMTGKMTPAGKRMMVRDFVKKVLFRRLKFFIKELHGIYHQSETSVCGLVIKNCNVPDQEATLEWWATMRKVVTSTHTDHRNNVIKTMRLRFRGKCFLIDAKECYSILTYCLY